LFAVGDNSKQRVEPNIDCALNLEKKNFSQGKLFSDIWTAVTDFQYVKNYINDSR
jgi:hypothetical protein